MSDVTLCDFPACRKIASVRFTVEEIGEPLRMKRTVDACADHAPGFTYDGDESDTDFIEIRAVA